MDGCKKKKSQINGKKSTDCIEIKNRRRKSKDKGKRGETECLRERTGEATQMDSKCSAVERSIMISHDFDSTSCCNI